MSQLVKIRGFIPYLLVVFLNAFVDLGHKIVIQNTVFKVYDGQQQIILTAIVNALILLPFILLFSPAGYFSDRFPKNKVMRFSAWAGVVITLMITACYYAGWFWAAFSLTFLLAIQSAIYSPAKYGYIKELVGTERLAHANGAVQAITIVGILLGTFVFSGLFEILLLERSTDNTTVILERIAPLGWLLVLLASIELMLSYRLPQQSRPDVQKIFSVSRYVKLDYLQQNLRALRGRPVIWLSIVGLSTFWAISQVLLAAFPDFAETRLAETNTLVIQGLLACSGLGIMIGAVLAGRFSQKHIETGLVPLGALGIAITLALLPALDSYTALAFNFTVLGMMGGLFMIPLNALIQYHAKEQELGTVLAGNNWVQNVTMLSFLGLTVAFAYFGFNSAMLLGLLTLVAVIGTGYTVKQLPHSFVRFLVSLLFKHRYRIDVLHFDNLPARGGVLLLGNHISWIDWALVQIACPRPVRFVMQREIYNRWYLKPLLSRLGMIPISSGNSKEALGRVNELLRNGEVVCLFPEGAISRNGHLGKFHSGYERTVEGVDNAVIVPFYLRGLWGSAFSRSAGKLRDETSLLDRSLGNRRDIIVAFGKSLPLTTKTAELKQKVFELSVDAWEEHTHNLDPLALTWLKTAKRNRLQHFMVDGEGTTFSYGRTLAATLAFAKAMRRYTSDANVGLVLPASSASLISNMAVLLNGQTTVNINYTSSVSAVRASLHTAAINTVFTSRRFMAKLEQRGIAIETMLADVQIVFLEDVKAALSKWDLLRAMLFSLLPADIIYWLLGRQRKLDDPAAILFSSGSEGTPKGIVLSHRNVIANCKQISDVLDTRKSDVFMNSLPPFHSFGLTVTTMMPMLEGIPVVCHPDPTDVVGIAKAIARYRATVLCGTATFLRLYTRNSKVEPLMLDSLRIVVAGAEKLQERVRSEFEMKFNKKIFEGYGTTETTPVISVNIPDMLDTIYWKLQKGNQPGTVGMPLPGSSIRIVDPDTLETLPQGEDGLILVSGTQLMLGYLNDNEKTAQAIVTLDNRRWYKTGDKGDLDEDGFLTIVDRYSRFAKIGGEMISLGAVEEKAHEIFENPEIELAAVALSDEKKGERILLCVTGIPTDTASTELRQQLLNGGMEGLMLPAEIHVMSELPKLGTGKMDYKTLIQVVAA
ncbi:MAG TPA: acyl-[ACP]--phospholipid O-acyltransferase [Cellvibrio sp.]|nr:acyl-[ACP]--phospholipid O-acyltransferase [Cellvibrio sp.]